MQLDFPIKSLVTKIFGRTLEKMATHGNPLKIALRKKMREEILNKISVNSRKRQSNAITTRVLASDAFKNAKTISIYLSTPTEVDTMSLLVEIFKQGKQVFVPSYDEKTMEMLKLEDMDDYESLPRTKLNIKQPDIGDDRENALTIGGIDLFIVPGIAFNVDGGRLGNGNRYYDNYFKRHFETYPERQSGQTILMGLAFKEQIVDVKELPIDVHDVKLDCIVTEGQVYTAKK